jgi:hypothetical protein
MSRKATKYAIGDRISENSIVPVPERMEDDAALRSHSLRYSDLTECTLEIGEHNVASYWSLGMIEVSEHVVGRTGGGRDPMPCLECIENRRRKRDVPVATMLRLRTLTVNVNVAALDPHYAELRVNIGPLKPTYFSEAHPAECAETYCDSESRVHFRNSKQRAELFDAHYPAT